MSRGARFHTGIGVFFLLVFLALPFLSYLAGTVRSPWGVTPTMWQRMQLRDFEVAAGIYAVEVGEIPQTDDESTWWEKLYAFGDFFSDLRYGNPMITSGREHLDIHGQPLVLEALPAQGSRALTVRSIGPNGVDERGLGDDWVARFEPADGTWYKAEWPRGRGLTILAAVSAVLLALVLGIWFHCWRCAIGVALLAYAGAMLMFVGPRCFDFVCRPMGHEGRIGPNAPDGEPMMMMLEATWFLLMIGVLMMWWEFRPRYVRMFDRYARWLHGVDPEDRASCVSCGYDIRHGSHSCCPECGAAIPNG